LIALIILQTFIHTPLQATSQLRLHFNLSHFQHVISLPVCGSKLRPLDPIIFIYTSFNNMPCPAEESNTSTTMGINRGVEYKDIGDRGSDQSIDSVGDC
jgi:hypothetical protein